MEQATIQQSRPVAIRTPLPEERQAITHLFDINGHKVYLTVGLYEDGMPGEIFLVLGTKGDFMTSGFSDAFAQAFSYDLQYGVPLDVLVDKFSGMRFEPSGMTKNPQIRFAKSIVDYVVRWLAYKFLTRDAQIMRGIMGVEVAKHVPEGVDGMDLLPVSVPEEEAPPCTKCGASMEKRGPAGWTCPRCGHFLPMTWDPTSDPNGE